MAQPKTAPLSIRPGDERLARIDAYAAKHGLARHAAVLALIDAGLFASPPMLSQHGNRVQPAPAKGFMTTVGTSHVVKQGPIRAATVQLGPTRPAPGSMLKGGKK